jgi:hypothetical protein
MLDFGAWKILSRYTIYIISDVDLKAPRYVPHSKNVLIWNNLKIKWQKNFDTYFWICRLKMEQKIFLLKTIICITMIGRSFKCILKVGVEESIVNRSTIFRVKTQTTQKVRLNSIADPWSAIQFHERPT